MERKPHPQTIKKWKREFEAALPNMKRVFDFRLRHLRGNARDEATADAMGLAWMDFLSLRQRGIDPTPWINKIAQYAALGATSAKSQTVNDILSRRNRHLVQSLHESEDGDLAPEVAAMHDRKAVSPADQAAANLDVKEWLDGLDGHPRKVAKAFAAGCTNTEVGAMVGHGRGTGSNIRRELRESWGEFEGGER